jgi:prepilin-type N-terminal cleavage/methylation domain-containing protein
VSRQTAFTLVELLIVIAIITILAGILFPVFAQAKLAAMHAVSIGNLKQIGLASQLYAADYDDGLPLFANGNAQDVGDEYPRVDTWVWTLQPYLKSLQVMVDPAMGDPGGFYGTGPNATYANQNAFPDYGVNYVFLAPWQKDSSGQCTQSGSVSWAGASHPARTIFYVESYLPNEDANYNPTGGYSEYGNWIVTAPGMLSTLSNSSNYCIWPGMDWSQHPTNFNNGQPFTAEASQRYNHGGNVEMLDGHALWMNSDQEAAGTDWATSTYEHTLIIHSDQYMWDYNDTFFGPTPPE